MKNDRGNWLWGLMAFFYDQFFIQFPPYRNLLRNITENLKSPSLFPSYVLDAGCGTGLLSIELVKRGYHVIGVDRSSAMLGRARKRKKEEETNNLFLLDRDLNTGINDQGLIFDKVFFIHSLYLLENPQKILRDIHSHLQENGEIFLCNPCRKLSKHELVRGGFSFLKEAVRERGLITIFIYVPLALAMGALNLIIQRKKKKRIFHCWDENGIIGLLKNSGFRLKWLKESCLGNSHLLICAVKEEIK